ncbi:MAG: MFS transporter [Anaerolineaceae bacterium]|nr:MFS transporter [Anaerolineaceae bacterium]
MTNSHESVKPAPQAKLSPLFKLIYGSGDSGRASFNTLRQIFYAIFLTDVVGLDPRLASIATLVSIIWDAINDPIVGSLSDNVRTKWGRRRPFLLIFSIPFALAFIMLWWAPPWESQIALMVHITLAYMISDTIQTLITVPYLALTPEIASDYDERTSLTTFRMLFNLIASLLTAVLAPELVDGMVANGQSLQQAYIVVAAIFGGAAIIPFLVIFAIVRERKNGAEIEHTESVSFKETIRALWKNSPFHYATGIYVFNWIAFDVVALMIPYFLLYWVARGDMLAKANLFGINLGVESAVLGALFIVAILTLPFWNWVSHKWSKRRAYISGILLWIVVEIVVLLIQPGQLNQVILLAAFVGIAASNAHIIPEALFPDVIDWAELQTNTRREGMYYGAIHFIRKMSSAIASFLALQVLGWSGYRAPGESVTQFTQSPAVLTAIRMLTGPVIVVLLLFALGFAVNYPLTRERQHQIQQSLARRKARRERRKG